MGSPDGRRLLCQPTISSVDLLALKFLNPARATGWGMNVYDDAGNVVMSSNLASRLAALDDAVLTSDLFSGASGFSTWHESSEPAPGYVQVSPPLEWGARIHSGPRGSVITLVGFTGMYYQRERLASGNYRYRARASRARIMHQNSAARGLVLNYLDYTFTFAHRRVSDIAVLTRQPSSSFSPTGSYGIRIRDTGTGERIFDSALHGSVRIVARVSSSAGTLDVAGWRASSAGAFAGFLAPVAGFFKYPSTLAFAHPQTCLLYTSPSPRDS